MLSFRWQTISHTGNLFCLMEKVKKTRRKMYSNADNLMFSNFLAVKAVCYKIGPQSHMQWALCQHGFYDPNTTKEVCLGQDNTHTHTHTHTHKPHAFLQWQCCSYPNCRNQGQFIPILGHDDLRVHSIFRSAGVKYEGADIQYLTSPEMVKIRYLFRWKNQIIIIWLQQSEKGGSFIYDSSLVGKLTTPKAVCSLLHQAISHSPVSEVWHLL